MVQNNRNKTMIQNKNKNNMKVHLKQRMTSYYMVNGLFKLKLDKKN